jgi:hypothetical protein
MNNKSLLDYRQIIKHKIALSRLFDACDQAKIRMNEYFETNQPRVGIAVHQDPEYIRLVEEFHHSFAALKPVLEALDLAKNKDDSVLDHLLGYIYVPKRHHRSGYIKQDICTALKGFDYSPSDKQLLKEIYAEVSPHLGDRDRAEYKNLIAIL